MEKSKKLSKEIEGTVVKIAAEGGERGEMQFDFAALPADIQAKLGPFGLGHKLGDAAAGKSGTEAEEAINKVWNGLMAGDWSVRAPAGPKVSLKNLTKNLSNLDPASQDAARQLLTNLGIKIPGFND